MTTLVCVTCWNHRKCAPWQIQMHTTYCILRHSVGLTQNPTDFLLLSSFCRCGSCAFRLPRRHILRNAGPPNACTTDDVGRRPETRMTFEFEDVRVCVWRNTSAHFFHAADRIERCSQNKSNLRFVSFPFTICIIYFICLSAYKPKFCFPSFRPSLPSFTAFLFFVRWVQRPLAVIQTGKMYRRWRKGGINDSERL